MDLSSLRLLLSVISGLFVFLFYLAIVRDAVKRVITPNPVSWLIWSLNDTLILFASLSAGAKNTLAVPLVYALLGWFIVAAALRNERRSPNRIETACLVGSFIGWLCYLLSLGALASLLIAVVVNTIGSIPTILRLFRDAKSERFQSWILVWIAGVCSLGSLERFELELLLFPINSLCISSMILMLTLRNKLDARTA